MHIPDSIPSSFHLDHNCWENKTRIGAISLFALSLLFAVTAVLAHFTQCGSPCMISFSAASGTLFLLSIVLFFLGPKD